MKFCLALIGLLLCCGQIFAAYDCPSICPAIYKPVCGQATVKGRPVRCEFSNSCVMGVNACTKGINWQESSCKGLSPLCDALKN
ncbi:PREDICTED: vasotab [Drosophila arizonae]|uniref:Vasotab n=1 Tax=Drosophila arizonae TaxID=7263 RepID=A0ABM1Q339_DROAR|nr:PREDICTED: vasotab [Drosophila arizonae]